MADVTRVVVAHIGHVSVRGWVAIVILRRLTHAIIRSFAVVFSMIAGW